MTEASTNADKLALLPTEQLQTDIVDAVERMADAGFEITSVVTLVDGTKYRAYSVTEERVHEIEDSTGYWLQASNRRTLFEQFMAEYDGLTAINLTETLRYQYDRATREHGFERAPFPAEDTPIYATALGEMANIGARVRILRDRFAGNSMRRYLPEKRDGQWQVNGAPVKRS